MRISRPAPSRWEKWLGLGFWALVAVVALARLLAVITENVNWDEFAILQRAVLTHREGSLVAGGRPGLGTLVLIPFAIDCVNGVDALVQARLLWTAMFGVSAAAFWLLLKELLPPSPYRSMAVGMALGLWVMAPPVLRFSTQVRTDQPAILFGVLGGLALLHSRSRTWWAPVAGILFALGFLFSQKSLYVGGLVGMLAIGQLLITSEWRPRREVSRFLLTVVCFVAVLLLYRGIIGRSASAPTMLPVAAGLEVFEDYRGHVGWAQYLNMLPFLVPQTFVVAALALVTLNWMRAPGRHGRELALAWTVFAMGVAVAVFHAGRFPYFYMTLGLFPACIGALMTGPVLARFRAPLFRFGVASIVILPLAAFALFQSAAFTIDSQSHQRESLEFVERNFASEARGFGTRAEFVCRQDPDPFPTWFSQHVRARFGGDDREERAQDLMDEIRERRVAFMVSPWPWDPYPEHLREFWDTRYAPYHGSIRVAGRRVQGDPGWSGSFEVIAPGTYTWRPASGSSVPLEVSGQRLEPSAVIVFDAPGQVDIGLPNGGGGLFVLALDEPPAELTRPFYVGF